ncbi:ankyrin repeat domain-containing protein 24-like [Octopus bimaculoides]|uniref:ankyrin repeat domain-containing protein 24-like n=1 Tax=Octopus bimaculoides TaxID=37653 RepID=UPI0022E95643|nr:ankyrin repeat domain-containing protein 24-like [Octopus bimaculoides]
MNVANVKLLEAQLLIEKLIYDWTKIDEKLLKAIQSNNIDKVEIILTKRTVITTKLGPDGYSCFHVACANGLSEIVELLISSGADVNACNKRGYCGLHLAAHNGFPIVASQLLKAGADIELKDTLEKTALHHACNKSCEDVVVVLIRNEANINAYDQK